MRRSTRCVGSHLRVILGGYFLHPCSRNARIIALAKTKVEIKKGKNMEKTQKKHSRKTRKFAGKKAYHAWNKSGVSLALAKARSQGGYNHQKHKSQSEGAGERVETEKEGRKVVGSCSSRPPLCFSGWCHHGSHHHNGRAPYRSQESQTAYIRERIEGAQTWSRRVGSYTLPPKGASRVVIDVEEAKEETRRRRRR